MIMMMVVGIYCSLSSIFQLYQEGKDFVLPKSDSKNLIIIVLYSTGVRTIARNGVLAQSFLAKSHRVNIWSTFPLSETYVL